MINHFKMLVVTLLLTFQAISHAAPADKINVLADAFMAKSNVPGMSIAVIQNNKISIFNYGYANELKKIPTTNSTIYTLASISKTFTASLVAVAAIEGKLNLDKPFSQYIPELKNNPNLMAITPNMLLAHVSSLPFNFTPAPATYSKALEDLNLFVPSYPPGSEFKYSNAGIGIMGYVLQNIYTQNYENILANVITTPLNMRSTYLNLPADKEQYIALGHDEHGIRPYDHHIEVWFAAASLKSTIVDMAKYLNAQINAIALKNKALAQAIKKVHQNKYCFANKISCEQLAWQAHLMSELNNFDDDTFYSINNHGDLSFGTQKIINNPLFAKKYFIDKTGNGYGMSNYIAYIPDQKIGVVILLNRSFLTNKAMGNQRIKLGRDILKVLEHN